MAGEIPSICPNHQSALDLSVITSTSPAEKEIKELASDTGAPSTLVESPE